jgi:hypothetical protein
MKPKLAVALLAISLLVPSHLLGQSAPGPIPQKDATPGQALKLLSDFSNEFREAAGDAFDTVMALNDAKLKGLLFYEPILHEAELAIHKIDRKAVTEDEKGLANEIGSLKIETVLYRLYTENYNMTHDAAMAQKILKADRDIKDTAAMIAENLKKH